MNLDKNLISQNDDFPHLSKAPISEAIIDLRTTIPFEQWNSDVIHKAFTAELPDYPIIEPQRQFRTNVTPKAEGLPETCTTDLGIYGYIFKTNDKLNIAQLQKTGVSFSRLAPYKDWNQLVTEAYRLWSIYNKCVSVNAITRVGVRFLNRFYSPLEGKIEDVLSNSPKPPVGLEATFLEFVHKDVINIPDTIYNVIINTMLKPDPINQKMVFIVDIDVFALSDNFLPEKIWGNYMDDIHNIKNRIFFNSIRPSVWEDMI